MDGVTYLADSHFISIQCILIYLNFIILVFIILLRGKLLRYVLTTAYRIGLCDGEHVFITLDLFHEDLEVLGSGANWQQRTFDVLIRTLSAS